MPPKKSALGVNDRVEIVDSLKTCNSKGSLHQKYESRLKIKMLFSCQCHFDKRMNYMELEINQAQLKCLMGKERDSNTNDINDTHSEMSVK